MTCEACEKMRFLPAEAGDIPDVLALYRERVRWMDEKGIRQRQSEGVLYVLRDAVRRALYAAGLRGRQRVSERVLSVDGIIRPPERSGRAIFMRESGGKRRWRKAERIQNERNDCPI